LIRWSDDGAIVLAARPIASFWLGGTPTLGVMSWLRRRPATTVLQEG